MIKAVLWDFGGSSCPARSKRSTATRREHGLPTDFLRTVNATNPHANAWARLERSDITPGRVRRGVRRRVRRARPSSAAAPTCSRCWPATSATRWSTLLDELKAARLPARLPDQQRRRRRTSSSRARRARSPRSWPASTSSSSRARSASRKPEPRFYEIACELLGVEPTECVFLDDLGINLKPAAAMGMTHDQGRRSADQAIDELDAVARHLRTDAGLRQTGEGRLHAGRPAPGRGSPSSRWPGCRSRHARHVAQVVAALLDPPRAGLDEVPRAHVLRLLLEPHQLAGVRVALEHLEQPLLRERVELLDADDRGRRLRAGRARPSRPSTTLPLQNTSRRDRGRIGDERIVEHLLERAGRQLVDRRAALLHAQRRLRA